jgi:predicted acetyltransferase
VIELQIRRAESEDIEKILELELYCYGMGTEVPPIIRERFDLIYDEYFVVEDDGKILASARLIPYEQNIRGILKPMGGISMVSSNPETRRRGYTRQLMLHMIEEANQMGIATMTLQPFKDTWYGALSFVKTQPQLVLEANPAQMKHWKCPIGYQVERLKFPVGSDKFKVVHDRNAEVLHGAVRRSEKHWKERAIGNRSSLAIALGEEGSPEGALEYITKGYMDFGEGAEQGTMHIRSRLWLNSKAQSALFNYIYLHADQIVKLRMRVYPGSDSYFQWLTEHNVISTKGTLPIMVRCINIQEALQGLPITGHGEIMLHVVDSHCPWNSKGYKLREDKESLEVNETVKPPASPQITIEGISALLYGTLKADELINYGWLSGISKDDIEVLSHWFPLDYPWMAEQF